ncbi:DNA repair protein RadC [uncultured Tissierella sp.]|uniref:RadC family protein n=1 Tax=uncultured Tissierella sp. TaxID=448160 RepID=UPI002804268D|nr:DNA repair protein RadC [uncultured Tissierella sp.]MDU5080541.1 DNA repair protein RadC [Bacillota bacterium]
MLGQLKLIEEKEIKKDSIKERAEQYGIGSLFDTEALSLITGIKEDILIRFNSLRELKEELPALNVTRLQKLKLEAFFNMAIRFSKENRQIIKKITAPEEVSNLLMDEMKFLQKEEFRILILDTKNQITKVETISIGTLNASIVHPRDVFKSALLNSANAIILTHNHPSGDPTPSNEDINITNRLIDAGNLIGIKVLDHIIIGDNRYISFKEKNLI